MKPALGLFLYRGIDAVFEVDDLVVSNRGNRCSGLAERRGRNDALRLTRSGAGRETLVEDSTQSLGEDAVEQALDRNTTVLKQWDGERHHPRCVDERVEIDGAERDLLFTNRGVLADLGADVAGVVGGRHRERIAAGCVDRSVRGLQHAAVRLHGDFELGDETLGDEISTGRGRARCLRCTGLHLAVPAPQMPPVRFIERVVAVTQVAPERFGVVALLL